MAAVLDRELLAKIEVISQGPNKDLLQRLVDILYLQEQYDDEALTPEESAMVEAGLEAIRQGDTSQFISLEDYEKERGL